MDEFVSQELKDAFINDVSFAFKALGDPVRFRIIVMLAGGELCACKFHEPLGLSQSLVSHHLRVLHDNGLITGRREGRNIYYGINEKVLANIKVVFDELLAKTGEKNDHQGTRAGVLELRKTLFGSTAGGC